MSLRTRSVSRGECHKWRIGKAATQFCKSAVLGAKIMAPLADTVGFVDGEAARVPFLEVFEEAGEHETLGRDVEDLVFASEEFRVALAPFGLAKRGV